MLGFWVLKKSVKIFGKNTVFSNVKRQMKVTVLGSQNLHLHLSDQDGVFNWPNNNPPGLTYVSMRLDCFD